MKRTKRSVIAALIAVTTLTLASVACAQPEGDSSVQTVRSTGADGVQERRPPPGTAWVVFGADTVLAEVARTPEARAEGLMYREDLPDGTGMLFIFDDLEIRSFWMQNTYVPLDIGFMDASYTVVDIQQMAPMTTDPHVSVAPAMFALEVREGWLAEHGIAVGSTAQVVYGAQLAR